MSQDQHLKHFADQEAEPAESLAQTENATITERQPKPS
ncbi:hypothetical protein SynPROSU1_02707 [Synechococcus sp. PROS-U-1]|nr:hypothetical protein SynPROSU1_02707 [Synechococcus sp. PROS-U-1]